jgi:hypothetical protein
MANNKGSNMMRMTEFERNCYGMSEESMRMQYITSSMAKFSGLEMVVMGVLSDAQELLSFVEARHDCDEGYKERVRKQMNIAKFILSEMIDSKEAV